jgi:trehalose 6-phosphate phosphatase
MAVELPAPLPRNLLSSLAQGCGLLLCLDYDGTLAEITDDPAMAWPYHGVRQQLHRLTAARHRIAVAIVTGRTLPDVKRLLGIESGLFFSGVHGLEFEAPDRKVRLVSIAQACATELSGARRWLAVNVPKGRGFRVEDKRVAVGLHYRLADGREAAGLCTRFTRFVARETPSLKLVALKMLVEAMPRVASKARALSLLKARTPASWVTVYFGDDTTDEDAFAALAQDDLGVMVGARRQSHAKFWVDGPAAVARELQRLAAAGLR